MGMAAIMVSGGQEWNVSYHAMTRRLEAEGVSAEQIYQTLEDDPERIRQAIVDEMQSAVELNIYARRLFMDPGREAYLGKKYGSGREEAGGRRTAHPKPKKRGRGDYFYTGHVVYVVVNGRSIVTAIIPTANQAETLSEWVDIPNIESMQRLVSNFDNVPSGRFEILRQNIKRTSLIRSKLPVNTGAFRSSVLAVARWLTKPGADWTLLVAHEQGHRSTIRDMLRMVRALTPGQRPKVLVERHLDLPQLVPTASEPEQPVSLRMIPVTGLNCSFSVRDKPNTYLRRWWKRMQKVSPHGGRLLMVVSPDTARMVLELADVQNRTAWRERLGLFSPGSAISLSWKTDRRGTNLKLQHRRF